MPDTTVLTARECMLDYQRQLDELDARDRAAGYVLEDELPGPAAEDLLRVADDITTRTYLRGIGLLRVAVTAGVWSLSHRSAKAWLVDQHGRSSRNAAADLKLARHLEHLPAVAAAGRSGDLSLDRLRAISDHTPTSDQRIQALKDPARGEEFLLEQAGKLDADRLARAVMYWAARADPDAEDRKRRRDCEKRVLSVAPTLGGVHLSGWMGIEDGAIIRTALRSFTGNPATGDTRSWAQRDLDALIGICRTFNNRPNATSSTTGVRPHLLVSMTMAAFLKARQRRETTATTGATAATAATGATGAGGQDAGTNEFLDLFGDGPVDPAVETLSGQPLAPLVTQRLVCDPDLTLIITDHHGQPLDVGRTRRFHTDAQRKALVHRDRGCVITGCHHPPQHCEAHHLTPWSEGGETNLKAVLLCWTHHQDLHDKDLQLVPEPDDVTDGRRRYTLQRKH